MPRQTRAVSMCGSGPSRDYRRGPVHSLCQMFALVLGCPLLRFLASLCLSLRELTPMVLTLQAESGPPCALRPLCYGPVAPCPFP